MLCLLGRGAPRGEQKAELANCEVNSVFRHDLPNDVLGRQATVHTVVCRRLNIVPHASIDGIGRSPHRPLIFLAARARCSSSCFLNPIDGER